MPEITKTYTIATDEHGSYQKTLSFDDPLPWGVNVGLSAEITAPPNTHANCTVTLNGQSKAVNAQTGQQVDLGAWNIASGSDVVTINGSTNPVLANAALTIDLKVTFSLI